MKYEQKWQARAVRPDGASDWFEAEVPGNVQYDYGRFMGWGDINYADNVLKYRETENYTWEYRTVLAYEETEGRKAYFVSEGIDYRFDILIGGKTKLSHEGMFTRIETELSHAAGQELIVRIHPHPKRAGAEFEDRQQADQCVKPPVGYGWDWHPRMLVSGIWQETYVETRTADHIRRCEPFYALSADLRHASIRFETDCDAPVTITLTDPNGNPVGVGDHFEIDDPMLWWCSGQGAQNLYTYTARTENHTVSGVIGLRSVRLELNELAWVFPVEFPKSRYSAPMQLVLNGRKVFAKGSNWVNPDIFNGRIRPDRYETLVRLARDANMNLLRCWGGSGIHKDAFYEACDRMGIMVWSEFPLACNNYEGTSEYLGILEQEASAIIRKLRVHPSVVLYCGGNELFNGWSMMTDQSPALRLLNKLCYELDPGRPYLMTSPLTGMGHGGYTFNDPRTGEDVFQVFGKAQCTAYTEFGCPSTESPEVLKKFIPEDELFPIEKEGSWKLHHAFDSWGPDSWLCMPTLERYKTAPLDSLDAIAGMSRWLQCEAYKAIFEEARRQSPFCSMALNWHFDAPWLIAAGNHLITYPDTPRPAYYAVQSALRPVTASARIPRFDWNAGECFRAELWLLNDSPEETEKTVRASIRLNGVEYPILTWETGTVPANQNKVGPSVNWTLPDVPADDIVLVLDAGEGASQEYRLRYRHGEEALYARYMNL